jgi:ribosome-associated protein
MALLAAQAARDKQAEQIVVMDLRGLSSVTDFFIVCTAGSARQIAALAEHIETVLTQQGGSVWHTEGITSASTPSRAFGEAPQWVLMDCGEVVVHLMDQSARDFYRLEDLWADAPRLSLPLSA